MLCKNTIQKVSNMVLFKDCKLSSAATKTCKYATKHKYMYKKNKRKKKKPRNNRGSSCSKNHNELIHTFILVFQVVRCSFNIYILNAYVSLVFDMYNIVYLLIGHKLNDLLW